MNTVSMRLPDELLRELDKRAAELEIPRTEYIRRAILAMNRALEDAQRRDRLTRASLKVRAESMKVNAEFAAVERAPEDRYCMELGARQDAFVGGAARRVLKRSDW